ncbi:MAG: nucleotidyltransferase domain-containing protein [Minisyncoccia bacterium]
MKTVNQLELETQLVLARENIFKKLETIFIDKAIEAHVFGSIARQQTDAHSDIDIWFTFKDEDFDEVYKNRFKYYGLIGEIIHSCEPPQNAPINGVYNALLIQSNKAITMVDIYLCPLSTSYISSEGKKLFGVDLPIINTTGYNQKKVQVDTDYRIDFFIGFIFNTIKKIARCEQNPLEAVLREYKNLHTNYKINVELLDNEKQDINTLRKIIENTKKVANEKQKKVLTIINDFVNNYFL